MSIIIKPIVTEKITKQGDKTFVNGSEIITSITTANGIIHVIGDVLLPK